MDSYQSEPMNFRCMGCDRREDWVFLRLKTGGMPKVGDNICPFCSSLLMRMHRWYYDRLWWTVPTSTGSSAAVTIRMNFSVPR